MGDIVDLPVVTRLDLDPERILRAALDAGMTEVVVIGVDRDGLEYFAASQSGGPDVLWHIERARHKLMQVVDQIG